MNKTNYFKSLLNLIFFCSAVRTRSEKQFRYISMWLRMSVVDYPRDCILTNLMQSLRWDGVDPE